jgi:PKD repeat protein
VNTVTIDVQVIAPLAAKFTFSPASPFAGRPVQFNGWAAGGLSPFDYAWAFGDGTTASEPRPSHVFSANGTYSVALTIQDASGQTANTSQVVGVAQRTPSVATGVATDVKDVRATLNGQLYYLGEANETLVGFHYGTDPSLINSTNWTAARAIAPQLYSAQVTGLTVNTTYYFEAWASGSGFATGGISSFITMASPPPLVVPTATLQVQGTLGRNGWYVSNVTIALTASAPRGLPAWTNVAVDGGGWVNYSAPLTLHDGRHSLEYYAFLGKGGLAEPHRFANISVDTTPPELSIQGSGEIVTQSSVTIAWTGSDGGSGILAYEVQLDGGSFQAIGTSTSLTLNLEDGAHTITVRATDVAGNVKAQTKALTIDTNPFSPRGPFAGLPLYLLLFVVAVAVGLLRLRRQRKGRRTPPDPWKL